jgi:hypothetical protein
MVGVYSTVSEYKKDTWKLGVVTHACDLNSQEIEAGES